MHRLEDPRPAVAEARRSGEAKPACDGGGDVREDVAEHVLRHDDIDRLGGVHKLHRKAVDECVAERNVRILRCDLLDDAPPQARGVEHIGLVDRHERAAAAARQLETAADDALDLIRVVLARVEDRPVLAHAAGAEVKPADELPHDHEIDVALSRRAQVGVDVELLPQSEKPLLGPRRAAVPSRPADRAEQDGPGGAARLERLGRQRLPGHVDRGAAEGQLHDFDLERQLLEHPQRLFQHLRPDPVARQGCNHVTHWSVPASRGRARRSRAPGLPTRTAGRCSGP